MRTGKIFVLILGLIGLIALPSRVLAEQYKLEFIPTQNALPGMEGTMTIEVLAGNTTAHFKLRGGYPNTVYTIWIVYNLLTWPLPTSGVSVPASSANARPGFPPEGNGVAPLAALKDGFTSGMGLDPGASFVTDELGHGQTTVHLDYDLIQEAPVGNKDIIVQCAPAAAASCERQVRVTTAWLRRFIGEFPLAERASMCANYDAGFDPESPMYDAVASKGTNARHWQCIDPATGLPRVHRFLFDHFRLANHPDDLTHGFIGGDSSDHWIDMVGRRADLVYTGSPAGGAKKKK